MNHYLITLDLYPKHRMHAYLISRKKDTTAVVNKMLDKAEEYNCRPSMITLVTELSTGIGTVREILTKCSPEVKGLLEFAKDFHVSVWTMPMDDPDDARLMALH